MRCGFPFWKIARVQEILLTGESYQAEKLVNAGYFNEDMISCQGSFKIIIESI